MLMKLDIALVIGVASSHRCLTVGNHGKPTMTADNVSSHSGSGIVFENRAFLVLGLCGQCGGSPELPHHNVAHAPGAFSPHFLNRNVMAPPQRIERTGSRALTRSARQGTADSFGWILFPQFLGDLAEFCEYEGTGTVKRERKKKPNATRQSRAGTSRVYQKIWPRGRTRSTYQCHRWPLRLLVPLQSSHQ